MSERTAKYNSEEIAGIRRSCAAAASILQELVAYAKPGVNPLQIDEIARARIRDAGVEPAFLGYEHFPAVLCTSVNNIVVHGVPNEHPFRDGDLLGLDFGVVLDGWYSDVAVTIPIGRVGTETQRLLDVTREALDFGIAQAKPGNRVGDISAAIQRHVEAASFQVIRELVGHGVGRQLHEPPQIPNFGKPGTGPELTEGMVIAIEPITSLSSPHVRLAADGFSYETTDGSLAAHFEHTIVITSRGSQILTAVDT
ncbi:MAG: type I methionyl aminopeptidase [Candidatus Terrybacteria bacterium RIFCSPLOWO2_01_FULL_58_14]|uniref:Methionine aminopeptidase n=2 Tax=Candidatus Terryibacteriota TaxID=1817920 RepID=A0A1G2PWR0_9BACT|nr:MAG: type I methionyl aminopeptidase [Candidatus Terrybacteria bacterium RIFCSPHIGHO2_01_FULL_58_15]OHA52756.1 MAG: type I methionyl aminopeptidase [Candidatus Terrybacteria bacterium RIFCSPLOWO2_01_FULL_58_14]